MLIFSRSLLLGSLLACLLLARPVAAQQPSEPLPGKDVASIRQWLLQHNAELRAQQAETEAAQAQTIAAGSLPNPTASVSLLGDTRYQLRQSIPLWGKRGLARDIASQQAQALDASREANALTLMAQAETAYVNFWHAKQSLLLLDGQLTLLQKVEEIAGVRYALGMAPQQDAIRAQVEVSRVQGERILREETGHESGILLNLVLGRRADAELAAPQNMPNISIASASFSDALTALDKHQHPAQRAAQAQLVAAQDTLRLRQRERWPDVSIGVSAMQIDRHLKDYELMLEVELPLQRRALAARTREAERLEAAAQARAEAQFTTLSGQLGAAWTQWRSAQRQRLLIENTRIPQAEANFNSSLASYQVGEVDFNALLDALTQWQDAKLAQLDAQRDELISAASVRALAGETP